MDIVLLGTGTSQGVPVISCKCKVCSSQDPRDKRLRTSAMVTTDAGENILLDIGPDFREQMLRERVMHLEGILVTHAHRDHVAGLDDIRAFNYVQNAWMNLYANHLALDIIRRDYGYMFSSHPYPGLPQVTLHEVQSPFKIGTQEVIPIKAMHKDMPILGYRLGPLVYITDANYIEDKELNKVKGCKLLVLNALRFEKHFSHYCVPEALEIIRQVAPDQAILTHASHDIGLYEDLEKMLPENVRFGYDGMKIHIGESVEFV